LALRLRRRFTTLLATTSSPPVFARAARRATLGAHLVLGAALVVMTAAVVFAVVHGGHSFGTEPRLLLLAGDYVVLGIALFSATVLAVLGAGGRAVAALAAGVAVLAAFLVLAADEPTPGWVPLACHAAVSTALLLALGVLVHRRVGRPVHHR
ncbi:MAG: hypothetical protein AB7V44_12935, partial [Pseudonocardia sp.]